jgi:hypothetical protein
MRGGPIASPTGAVVGAYGTAGEDGAEAEGGAGAGRQVEAEGEEEEPRDGAGGLVNVAVRSIAG